MPTVTEARDGPASRTASVRKPRSPAQHPDEQKRPDPAEVELARSDERQHAKRDHNRQQCPGLRVRRRRQRRTSARPSSSRTAQPRRAPARPRPRFNATATTIPRRDRPTQRGTRRADGQPAPRRPAGLAGPGAGAAARAPARPGGRARDRPPGAYYLPRINWGPERFRADLDWALEAPLELPGELPPIERYQVDNEDARLTIARPRTSMPAPRLHPSAQAAPTAGRAREPSGAGARGSLGARRVPDRKAAAAEAGMSLEDTGVRLRRLPAGWGRRSSGCAGSRSASTAGGQCASSVRTPT